MDSFCPFIMWHASLVCRLNISLCYQLLSSLFLMFRYCIFVVSKAYVSNKFFMGKNQLYKLILPAVCCCVFILIKIKLELLADYELGYPDGIFFWICCLSIGECGCICEILIFSTWLDVTKTKNAFDCMCFKGRQWFLDMEIYPRKYENHFKNKLGIVSTVSTVTA